MELRAVPDPGVYPTCEWCGGGENLGMLVNDRDNLNHITCYRCYMLMFPEFGRRGIG